MKLSRTSARLSILIASVLLLSGASPRPQPRPRGSAQVTNSNTAPHTESIHPEIAEQYAHESIPVRVMPIDVNRDRLDYINPILTFLLVLVGIAYTVVSRCQLRAIGRQTSTAERELVIANRAYLYLSGVHISLYEPQIEVAGDEPVYNYVITYPIYNGGQTPALYIGAFARAIVDYKVPQEVSHSALALDRTQNAVVPPRAVEPLNPHYPSFLS